MPLSFFDFFFCMTHQPLLLLTVILTLAVLLVNGCTDAPNAIAGVVATGTLSFSQAVRMAALFNFLGVLCVTSVSTSVAESIFSIAVFPAGESAALIALCAAMASIVLWATAAWWFGIPTSESHALIASISGSAIALERSLSCIRWDRWGQVLWGLFFSVLCGGLVAFQVSSRLSSVRPNHITVKLFQIAGSASSAFLHGAQDGQKFLGVFLLCAVLSQGCAVPSTFFVPVWAMVLCALCMALGTCIGGRRIIDKVGRELVSLRPLDGLSAEFGSIISLGTATILGLPVSTTHTRTAALLGAGLSGSGHADWRVARQIVLAWLFTFPGCAALGFGMTCLLLCFA